MGAQERVYTPRNVIVAYLVSAGLFTLAASLIWAINTLFLVQSGLTLFQVMLVNAVYTGAQLLFEVPTGVVADTIGRRISFLISIATLVAATLLYVATPTLGWGFWGFAAGSVLIGLGFCFQTGATDAWLVDALDHTGYEGPKDQVFSWGGMTFSGAMLVGTLVGGFVGQVNLALPYLLRAVALVFAFIAAFTLMRDLGFEKRPLRRDTIGAETRRVFDKGVRYGWGSPAVRPLLLASAVGGLFFMFGFYGWQQYILLLLGKNYVWLVGVIQAVASLAGILGNVLVPRIMGRGEKRRDPSRVLSVLPILLSVLIAGIGVVGLVATAPGWGPTLAASGLWVLWGVIFGAYGPIYQGYINTLIPSAQRATVLSLDALFGDAGSTVGPPALGWVTDRFGFPPAYLIGSLCVLATSPLIALSGRNARRMAQEGVREAPEEFPSSLTK